MLSRTLADHWEAARLHLNRVRSWLGTPERTDSLLLLLWPLVALVIALLVIRLVSSAKELADLLSALASLMWPLVALVIVGWFRPELRAILSRIRKGKFLGQEIEFAELEAKTEAAEATSSMIVSATGTAAGTGSATAEGVGLEAAGSPEAVQDEIEEVLREATRSPRLGLMLLSAKIERAARELAVADTNLPDFARGPRTLTIIVRQLVAGERLPQEAAEALHLFTRVRNRIVHGHDTDDDEIARAIDYGNRLLRLLLSRPRSSAETAKGPDGGD